MKYKGIITLCITLLFIACSTDADTPEEVNLINQTTQVYGQGFGGTTISGAEANLHRTRDNGIFVNLYMPTLAPGSYTYPEGTEQGTPEVFTLWIFAFNDPESDQFDAAYLGSAHVAADVNGNIELKGHITTATEPFTGEGHLTNYMGAKIRLTVAPHGTLDADKLPGQLTTPSGGPDFWWIAEFEAPENGF